MDSEGILHFSFFFYALMKGRIATISFGCLWINKFKKGGTHMKETKICQAIHTDDTGTRKTMLAVKIQQYCEWYQRQENRRIPATICNRAV